jgi:hypothetical protein
MDINRLKLIDKVLGIIVIALLIIALFYRQLLLEVGVLGLFWLVLDTYVAFKTSKLNFVMDILFIAAFAILSILAPNLFCVSTLASLMPSTSIPKETLTKLLIAVGLLAIVVLYVVDVVRMIREVEIVL